MELGHELRSLAGDQNFLRVVRGEMEVPRPISHGSSVSGMELDVQHFNMLPGVIPLSWGLGTGKHRGWRKLQTGGGEKRGWGRGQKKVLNTKVLIPALQISEMGSPDISSLSGQGY